MNKKPNKLTLRIVIKYFLLQLPGQMSFAVILLLFRQWVEVPGYLTWVLLGVWVAKDVCLFPFLWRFYDPSHYPDRFRMVGRRGYALTRLDPDGYVQVRGERWRAAIADGQSPIEQGRALCVQAIKGLELTVKSCAEDQPG